jgi:hypothetical protein
MRLRDEASTGTMPDDTFVDPEGTRERWVDVRMTDPDQGEWDVDVVVAGARVEYVDLRIDPAFLASFLGCLVSDVDDRRAESILTTVAERNGLDPDFGGDSDSDSDSA